MEYEEQLMHAVAKASQFYRTEQVKTSFALVKAGALAPAFFAFQRTIHVRSVL
jgi:hypothetical protein